MTEGTILHLQRLSTEDGPGLRTTVFFKGCPLRCVWCHNPESISARPQVQWLENRCIACKLCIKACPPQALVWTGQGVVRERARCQVCGECVEVCPANAQELLGHKTSVETLVSELVKDQAYFDSSGGGVTLSGGEPALQPDFSLALLQALRRHGVATALDTCGVCQTDVLERLVEASDLILFDLKLMDPQQHRRWTGASNDRILANLRWLGEYLRRHPQKKLWLRTPLIPGATWTEENITGIGAWLAEHLPRQVERWELCAFNNLCRDKYRRLELDWDFASASLLAQRELDLAWIWASASGFDPGRVFVTGTAQAERV